MKTQPEDDLEANSPNVLTRFVAKVINIIDFRSRIIVETNNFFEDKNNIRREEHGILASS